MDFLFQSLLPFTFPWCYFGWLSQAIHTILDIPNKVPSRRFVSSPIRSLFLFFLRSHLDSCRLAFYLLHIAISFSLFNIQSGQGNLALSL